MLIVLYNCYTFSVPKMITFYNNEGAIWTPWVWGYGHMGMDPSQIGLSNIQQIQCK